VRGVFEGVGVGFGVFELLRARDAAEDLDAWAGGVAEEAQEGEADADCDSDAEVPEEGCEEDEDHEEEFRVAGDFPEEVDVVGGFFDEGVGDDGNLSGENGFLGGVC
jgi:hypothetical protein